MTDIVERLRELERLKTGDPMPEWLGDGMDWGKPMSALAKDAADTIVHMREMLERLIAPGGAARIGPSFAEITKDVPRKLVVE